MSGDVGGISRRALSAAIGAALFAPGVARGQVGNEEDTAQVALIEDVSRRMTGPVRVNGRGPFSFVIDTGANVTVISQELAEALGLEPTGEGSVHGIVGVERTPTTLVSRLTIGAVRASNLQTPILRRRELGGDGLLGVDVMRNRVVRLDFAKWAFQIGSTDPGFRSIGEGGRLTRGFGEMLVGDAVVAPARQRFGQLMTVNASMKGVRVSAFIDSGAQSTVGNAALLRATRGVLGEGEQSTRVTLVSATGQTIGGDLLTLPELRIGRVRLGRLPVAFADLHAFDIWGLQDTPAILIGMDVLRRFRSVELNFRRSHVVFEGA